MPEENSDLMILKSDEEWEGDMKGMTDDQRLAYIRRMFDELANDPEALELLPAGTLESLQERADDFERAIRRCKIALQNEALSKAQMERTADEYLARLNEIDKSRGN